MRMSVKSKGSMLRGVGLLAMVSGVPGVAVACGGAAATSEPEPAAAESLAPPNALSFPIGASGRPHVLEDAQAARDGGVSPSGFVQVSTCVAGADCGGGVSQFYAQFTKEPTQSSCTLTAEKGACATYACASSAPVKGVSAGAITIAGPHLTSTAVQPGQDAVYEWSGPLSDVATGDVVTATGAGDVVPAFGPWGLTVYAYPALAEPAANAKGTYEVSTSKNLKVAWSGGQSTSYVNLQIEANDGSALVSCSWQASGTSGVVPAETLAPLAGKGASTLSWGSYAYRSLVAGKYESLYETGQFLEAPANLK